MVPTTKSSRLIGVQYLRAVGALMIVHFHATIQISQYTPYFDSHLLGGTNLANGVDLFFVISGFIMLVSSQRLSPAEFLIRRIIRIVPLYWVLTGLVVVMALWRPELFRTTVVRPEYVLKSLLFIPYANPGQDGLLVPLLVPGWSLNFEMFFYLLFAASLFAPARWRLPLTGAVFVALLGAKAVLGPSAASGAVGFLADLRLFEFWLGMVIGQLFVSQKLVLPAVLSWFLVCAGFIVLVWGVPLLNLPVGSVERRLLESLIPSAAVVLGMVSVDARGHIPHVRFLAYLGDASYSIYLSHIFSLGVARFAWAKLGLEKVSPPYIVGFAAVSIIAALIGAAIVYRYLETPMLEALQRWHKRRRKDTAARVMSTQQT